MDAPRLTPWSESGRARRNAQILARGALIAVAIVFAFLRLSEGSADPDLWGHVLYGQRHYLGGELERYEPFSWTAPGAPWINHEIGAELAMGIAHLVAGARGLWILMVVIGGLTLGLAFFEARRRLPQGPPWLAWAVLAVASREVAVGFAMRPQVFSALFWVLFLIALRALFDGRRWPLWAVPALFGLWINTHGGVLLAAVALVAGLAAAIGVCGAARFPQINRLLPWPVPGIPVLRRVAVACGLGWTALLLNPYGWRLPAWLLESVTYVRPQISEWGATAWSPTHAVFWALAGCWLIVVSVRSFGVALWEAVVGLLVLWAAIRHERHVPLFALTMIAFLPGAIGRWLQVRPIGSLSVGSVGFIGAILAGTACLGLVRLYGGWLAAPCARGRMHVDTTEYPVEAVRFIRRAGIRGNAIVYFDWAQQALWELPDSRVSFDGRLDTCYPRPIIDEHWRFFHGGVRPERTFSLEGADWAMIPPDSPAAPLLQGVGWTRVYRDSVADVYVKEALAQTSPNDRPDVPPTGCENFPDEISPRARLPGR